MYKVEGEAKEHSGAFSRVKMDETSKQLGFLQNPGHEPEPQVCEQ